MSEHLPSAAPDDSPPPPPSAVETTAALCERSGRSATPIRSTFVQQPRESDTRPSVLAEFVHRHARRQLDAYLLLLTAASAEPYDVRLPSEVWARALSIDVNDPATAVSKTWSWLEDQKLVARRRVRRLASLTPLREDGSGRPYERPSGGDGDVYLNLDHAYWLEWRPRLTLAGVVMLLVSLHEKPGFELPFERVPEWYGFSADVAQSGMSDLLDHGLISRDTRYEPEPLSKTGWKVVHSYTVQQPFGRGEDS